MRILHKLAAPAVVLALLGTGYVLISSLVSQNTAVQAKSNNTLLNKKINWDINKINIKASDNIRVKLGNEYKVTYDGPKKSTPDVRYHNGELELSSPRSFFNIFFFIKRTYNLTITVPKTKLQSFNVNSSNGDVMITHLEANGGNITDSNGDISIGNLITQNGFYLSASNGNIKVEKGNATGFALSNSNGNNTIKGVDVSDDYEQNSSKQNVLTADNSNGDIDIF